MRDVRYEERFRDLTRRVTDGPGQSDAPLRRGAFDGTVPDDLAAYIEKVRLHAYKVTEADVEALKAAGYSEDQLYEITIAAALGAGMRRYEAGMKAMRG